jgi:plastocyanin
MTPLVLRLAAIFLLFVPLAVACGDDDDESSTPGLVTQTPNIVPSIGGPQEQPQPAQELDTQQLEPSDGVVELAASGTRYAHNHIRINVGEAVTIRLTNEDTATHNLRIAGIDGEFETEDDAVTTPDAISGGQVGELTFAPPAAGEYTFRCDFHPGSMGGQIVVAGGG